MSRIIIGFSLLVFLFGNIALAATNDPSSSSATSSTTAVVTTTAPAAAANQPNNAATIVSVPILAYHRFAPTQLDSMTTTLAVFDAQLKWLKDNHYTVIPLQTLVSYLQGKGPAPGPKSVVITADDGHQSVYRYMLPRIREYHYPVTLFIYPSAISNASYAMTWQELQTLQKTGLFDIQGHTYWHPNFNHEKKKQTPADYAKFVDIQLKKSKAVLDKKLNINVTLLAWPFGIYNPELEAAAAKDGYVMAFSIDGRNARPGDNAMAVPRYLLINKDGVKGFAAIAEDHAEGHVAKEG